MKPIYLWLNEELVIIYPAIEDIPDLDHVYCLDTRFEDKEKRYVIMTVGGRLGNTRLSTPCDPDLFPPGFKTALLLLDLLELK